LKGEKMNKIKYTILIFTFIFALNLPAQTPMYYNLNTGTSSNSFPFNMSGGKAVNTLFLANEFINPTPLPPGQQITAVYFRTSTAGTRTYTNLHILMAQDSTLTAMTSGTFYPGPYDTVFVKDTSLTSTVDGWMKVKLAHPFVYNPAKSLILFVGQCGSTGSGQTVRNSSLTPAVRRVWSVGGCPFVPYASMDGATINFGVDVEPAPILYYNFSTGGGANSFPLNQQAGKMVQWLLLPYELSNPSSAPLGVVSKIAFRIATGYPLPTTTYSQFNILIGQSTITGLTSGVFYTGLRDSVYKRASVTLSAAADSWLVFTLDQTFVYNPGQSLIVQMEQCGAPGVTGYSLAHTTLTGNRRVWSIGGCPYAPYAGAGTNVVNCGLYIVPITSSSPVTTQIPDDYKLEQNYPNPFNPLTKINFDIPKTGFVSVKIFDVLGKEIKMLVNEVKNAGSYSIEFDGSSLASGTYFYRMESGGFIATKKMILIK
jgi:hypothetical protein